MHHVEVVVYLFFGIKDLTAFRAHVLSRSSFRGAFAFDDLTQFSAF